MRLTLLLCLLLPTLAQAAPAERTLQRRELPQRHYEQMAEDARERLIGMLQEMLSQDVAADKKPELLLRLGDLLAQRSRARRLELGERCVEHDECDADESVWRKPLEKAQRLFAVVATNYPRHQRAHDAAWMQGLALLELGRADDAAGVLAGLTRKHPDSDHAGDAWLLLGEHHFDQDDAFRALQAYQRAAGDQRTAQRSHAEYMVAWCQYNLGQMDDAIATMRRLAFRAAKDGGGRGPGRRLRSGSGSLLCRRGAGGRRHLRCDRPGARPPGAPDAGVHRRGVRRARGVRARQPHPPGLDHPGPTRRRQPRAPGPHRPDRAHPGQARGRPGRAGPPAHQLRPAVGLGPGQRVSTRRGRGRQGHAGGRAAQERTASGTPRRASWAPVQAAEPAPRPPLRRTAPGWTSMRTPPAPTRCTTPTPSCCTR